MINQDKVSIPTYVHDSENTLEGHQLNLVSQSPDNSVANDAISANLTMETQNTTSKNQITISWRDSPISKGIAAVLDIHLQEEELPLLI